VLSTDYSWGVTGLRERKKSETRRHIADTAARLFAERGFEAVTVDEVAEAAEVSKKTVFNYFPTKEDLVFDRAGETNEEIVQTIRDRPAGQSLPEAFRDRMLRYLTFLREQPPGFQRGGVIDLINESPALMRRSREVHHQAVNLAAAELAVLVGADEDDPLPSVAAHNLLGAHNILFRRCMRLLRTGLTPAEVADAMEPEVRRVFELLSGGLGDYGRDRSATIE
jgi:AcrR family transcriptional regulator